MGAERRKLSVPPSKTRAGGSTATVNPVFNYMNKIIRPFLVPVLVLLTMSGCLKSPSNECKYDACATKAPANEIQDVQNYLTANNITAVQHCSGVFYVIDSLGTGATPTPCSFINANYTGRLTNGTVFDHGPFQQPYQLTGLIPGWTNTIPLIKKGGRIHLYVPPSLGYGSQPFQTIPANSILIFDIDLTFVQ
jgi:FKBP-type peptidyl-prolyl cis-trans isomerase FkpA